MKTHKCVGLVTIAWLAFAISNVFAQGGGTGVGGAANGGAAASGGAPTGGANTSGGTSAGNGNGSPGAVTPNASMGSANNGPGSTVLNGQPGSSTINGGPGAVSPNGSTTSARGNGPGSTTSNGGPGSANANGGSGAVSPNGGSGSPIGGPGSTTVNDVPGPNSTNQNLNASGNSENMVPGIQGRTIVNGNPYLVPGTNAATIDSRRNVLGQRQLRADQQLQLQNRQQNLLDQIGTGIQTDQNNWRMTNNNGQWWYWTPGNYWMYYRDNAWSRYDANAYQPAPTTTGYRGAVDNSKTQYYLDENGRRYRRDYSPELPAQRQAIPQATGRSPAAGVIDAIGNAVREAVNSEAVNNDTGNDAKVSAGVEIGRSSSHSN